MVIQYNSRQETEMSGTSLPAGRGLPTSNLFEVEYWVTGKEADNHISLKWKVIEVNKKSKTIIYLVLGQY